MGQRKKDVYKYLFSPFNSFIKQNFIISIIYESTIFLFSFLEVQNEKLGKNSIFKIWYIYPFNYFTRKKGFTCHTFTTKKDLLIEKVSMIEDDKVVINITVFIC